MNLCSRQLTREWQPMCAASLQSFNEQDIEDIIAESAGGANEKLH